MTPKRITTLLFLIGLVGCGGENGAAGGDNTGDTSPLSPEITDFTASAAAITEGASASLAAVFLNGSGSIDNGVGAVASGASTTVTPTETTNYTLTVTNSAGVSVSNSVTITVEPAPVITSFTASTNTITEGASVALNAVFSNGSGSIDNGMGAVTSGASTTVTPMATTTYTLTVTNSVGQAVNSSVTIIVTPAPSPIITSFTASATEIQEGASVTLTGVFSNGSGSIDNGVGAINSGASTTVTPSATTTYTLMVTNSVGVTVNSSITMTVELAPTIASFTASATEIQEGASVILTAVFLNGSGSIDNGVGAVTSGASTAVTPSSTTTYTLMVTNSAGVSVASSVNIVVEPDPAFVLQIISPNNRPVGDDIEIVATVDSEFDIATVTADVAGRSTTLIFSSEASCGREYCTPGFVGQLSLSGLSPGSYVLTVTAVDVAGRAVSVPKTIVLDRKPVLTVIEPLQQSVATPDLPLDITCTDDVGDCEITVSIEGGNTLTTAVNALSETVDLSAFDGQEITLIIQGKDTANQSIVERIRVFVEASANLIRVRYFSGEIVDFDGQRALLRASGDNGDSLTIVDIATDVSTDVEVLPALSVSATNSFLAPTGAIYTAQVDGDVQSVRIYDWNNSLLQDLGYPNSPSSLRVAGDYAIWSAGIPGSSGTTLERRQFSTAVTVQVSTSAGNAGNSVASNGVVAYWTISDYTIVRFDAGGTTLASDVAYWNLYVETDGSRFVYRKQDPCCGSQQYAISFHDGTSETVLTNFRDERPDPGRDYQINNGWVAYTELGGLSQTHVWTNDPAGTALQRSIFGSNSIIDGLSADGEVMLINSGKRYLSDTTGQLTEVSSSLGSSKKVNGVWYITLGRALFEVK